MQITTDAEREAALDRAQELMGALEGTPEERELEELSDALEDWEHRASVRHGRSGVAPLKRAVSSARPARHRSQQQSPCAVAPAQKALQGG